VLVIDEKITPIKRIMKGSVIGKKLLPYKKYIEGLIKIALIMPTGNIRTDAVLKALAI
tara:strand:- start:11 stop:184 length:174 start_codon:yes stop_codon:yes gene_type:complete